MQDQVDLVAPAARALARGACAVALGGSLAKGVADAHSDLDIYVFAEAWLNDGERDAMIARLLPAATSIRSWGRDDQAGTDFVADGRPVEIWLRALGPLRRAVDNALAGTVVRTHVTWTPNGYYEHCALADLATLRPLSDEAGLLAPLLADVSTYPPALRAVLLAEGLRSVRFWRGNFHLETALLRDDAYYLQSILQQIGADLVQALFALNRTYFPGDKKLGRYLAAFPLPAAGLAETLSLVVAGGAPWRARFDAAFRLADAIAAEA